MTIWFSSAFPLLMTVGRRTISPHLCRYNVFFLINRLRCFFLCVCETLTCICAHRITDTEMENDLYLVLLKLCVWRGNGCIVQAWCWFHAYTYHPFFLFLTTSSCTRLDLLLQKRKRVRCFTVIYMQCIHEIYETLQAGPHRASDTDTEYDLEGRYTYTLSDAIFVVCSAEICTVLVIRKCVTEATTTTTKSTDRKFVNNKSFSHINQLSHIFLPLASQLW